MNSGCTCKLRLPVVAGQMMPVRKSRRWQPVYRVSRNWRPDNKPSWNCFKRKATTSASLTPFWRWVHIRAVLHCSYCQIVAVPQWNWCWKFMFYICYMWWMLKCCLLHNFLYDLYFAGLFWKTTGGRWLDRKQLCRMIVSRILHSLLIFCGSKILKNVQIVWQWTLLSLLIIKNVIML